MNTTNSSSIANDRAYTQALSDLIAAEVAASQVKEFTPGFEVNPAFTAAQEATVTGWKALAAIVDAHCARQ